MKPAPPIFIVLEEAQYTAIMAALGFLWVQRNTRAAKNFLSDARVETGMPDFPLEIIPTLSADLANQACRVPS